MLTNKYNIYLKNLQNVHNTNLAHSKEYKEISSQNTNLMESIADKIKDTEVIEEYKKTEYDMYEMQLQQAYLTGFKDSNIILNNQIIFE